MTQEYRAATSPESRFILFHLVNGTLLFGAVLDSSSPGTIRVESPVLVQVESRVGDLDGYVFHPYLAPLAEFEPGESYVDLFAPAIIAAAKPSDHLLRNFVTYMSLMIDASNEIKHEETGSSEPFEYQTNLGMAS